MTLVRLDLQFQDGRRAARIVDPDHIGNRLALKYSVQTGKVTVVKEQAVEYAPSNARA